ncbi:MAG: cache domain-containing protein [Candidatus Falkowbacteria bacterium]
MVKIFTNFSDLKISRKIFLTFFTLFFLAITSLILNNYIFFNEAVHRVVEAKADYGNRQFYSAISNQFDVLSALSGSAGDDAKLQSLFIAGDREALYSYTKPLFETYKLRYGISGWYFLDLNGQRVLRVQQKDLFGDIDNTELFKGAQSSSEAVYGFGMNEKAFSFRVVSPLSYQGKVVGYLEFEEGIDDLLARSEKNSDFKFAFIANKKYVDKNNFFVSKKKAASRNNWGDMPDDVMVNNIVYSPDQDQCFSEDNVNSLQTKKFTFQQINWSGKTEECAGFLFFSPYYEDPFKILYLVDVSEQVGLFNQNMIVAIIFLFITLILVTLAIVLVSRMITAPMRSLLSVIRNFTKGDLKRRFDPSGHDETGELGVNFNLMADVLEKNKVDLEKKNIELQNINNDLKNQDEILEKKVVERTADLMAERDNLEKKVTERTTDLTTLNKSLEERVAERTVELQKKITELSKFNRIAVNRELKMVELKKEIKQLKNTDKL